MTLELPTVTAVCCDGTLDGNRRDKLVKIFETLKDKIKFGGGIKYFSHIDPKCEGIADYIHIDGFPINLHLWKPEFLKFDYIGSPWGVEAETYSHQYYNNQVEGGGGGFSIRSAKLMKLARMVIDKIEHPSKIRDRIAAGQGCFNEDCYICYEIRHFLKQNGCIFAPYHLGKLFSLECNLDDGKNDITNVFGFHGHRHISFDQGIEILNIKTNP